MQNIETLFPLDNFLLEIMFDNMPFEETVNTSFMIGSKIITFKGKDYFIKKLNLDKINKIYDGEYEVLWRSYYLEISKYIDCVKSYAMVRCDDSLYEILDMLDTKTILSNKNLVSWNQLLIVCQKLFIAINNISKRNKKSSDILGLDTSIWNFTTEGKSFDFSPPRYMFNKSTPIFTRKDDVDHYNRTFYRNFTEEGMKTSLATSIFSSIEKTEVVIPNIPCDWQYQIIKMLLDSCDFNQFKYIYNCIYNNDKIDNDFPKHPIRILKEKVGKNNA